MPTIIVDNDVEYMESSNNVTSSFFLLNALTSNLPSQQFYSTLP